MTLLHASEVFLPLLLGFLPCVDPGADGKTPGPNRGRGLGKGQIVRVECLDGAFEEPFLHDISTFVNPPKSGFYNAVHMSLIPKGPHRGKILTFDIDPTHFEDEGTERGTWVQRWSIATEMA